MYYAAPEDNDLFSMTPRVPALSPDTPPDPQPSSSFDTIAFDAIGLLAKIDEGKKKKSGKRKNKERKSTSKSTPHQDAPSSDAGDDSDDDTEANEDENDFTGPFLQPNPSTPEQFQAEVPPGPVTHPFGPWPTVSPFSIADPFLSNSTTVSGSALQGVLDPLLLSDGHQPAPMTASSPTGPPSSPSPQTAVQEQASMSLPSSAPVSPIAPTPVQPTGPILPAPQDTSNVLRPSRKANTVDNPKPKPGNRKRLVPKQPPVVRQQGDAAWSVQVGKELRTILKGPCKAECVERWQQLEEALGFPGAAKVS